MQHADWQPFPASWLQDIDHFRWALTEEAQSYADLGSPEAQVFNIVPPEGLPMAQLKVTCRLACSGAHRRPDSEATTP